MLRSMFTAINSLNIYQSYMDVVADNLSNANTVGYKASRVTFQDQIAQLISSGSAPNGQSGGVNPLQIGLGSKLGSINANFNQGMLQSTGRGLDMAIQGDGFFVYSDSSGQSYSRDGSLKVDSQGYLVNASTGQHILGWQASSGSINTSVAPGAVQIPLGSTLARGTAKAALGGNLNSRAELGAGGAHQASLGVYDSLGVLHSINLTFTRSDDGEWGWVASGDGATGSGTVTFGSDGQITGGASGAITIPGSGGASDTVFTLDMSGLTQLAMDSSTEGLSQDGLPAGSLQGFDVVSGTGEVYAVYSNGMKQVIGQVAVANFVNPSGLVRLGQNLFQQGLNSGEPAIGVAGSGGRGKIVSGYLEASNVDMAQEFTNMIIAQRGFQASSRIITTSDEMIQELVNIKR